MTSAQNGQLRQNSNTSTHLQLLPTGDYLHDMNLLPDVILTGTPSASDRSIRDRLEVRIQDWRRW